MRTRSTPRQIAAEVIQSLAELTANPPQLRQLYSPLREAFLTGKQIPVPGVSPRPAWLAIVAATRCTAVVMVRARAGDTTGAWIAAADATYWHGAAEAMMSLKAVTRRAKAEDRADARRRKTDGQQKGATTLRVQKAARRERAIALFRTGQPWTKIAAANDIAPKLGVSVDTVKDIYLKGVKA